MIRQHCHCDVDYYGNACDLYIHADFQNPQVISPNDIGLHTLDEPEQPDAVDENYNYGGGV